MKTARRITAILLTLVISALLFGCGTKEKTLTVYNASDMFLAALEIADTEDFSEEGNILTIYGKTNIMQAGQSSDIKVDIPSDMFGKELYLYVRGSSIEKYEMHDLIVPIGTGLKDSIWGFSIDFDEEADTFVVTVLDSSSI